MTHLFSREKRYLPAEVYVVRAGGKILTEHYDAETRGAAVFLTRTAAERAARAVNAPGIRVERAELEQLVQHALFSGTCYLAIHEDGEVDFCPVAIIRERE